MLDSSGRGGVGGGGNLQFDLATQEALCGLGERVPNGYPLSSLERGPDPGRATLRVEISRHREISVAETFGCFDQFLATLPGLGDPLWQSAQFLDGVGPAMKQLGKILGGAYVLGIWIYGLWYVWEHWAEASNIGTLAGVAFVRAIVWPVWVVLALMQA